MRAAGLVLALLGLAAAQPAREPNKADLLLAVEKQLRAASESVGPCVALVVVSRSDKYPKPAAPRAPGKLGTFDRAEFLKLTNDGRAALEHDLSDPRTAVNHDCACGLVLSADGLILTPFHVVDGATKVFVHLPGRAGSYADIFAADGRYDLAVLKLIAPPAELKPVRFGLAVLSGRDATVSAGKLVVSLGHAPAANFALERPRTALGGITGVRRPVPGINAPAPENYYAFGPLLEHDARAVAAPDGAPLVNLDGEVIGLCTSAAAPAGERGPHLAFPVDASFRRVLDVLKRGEELDYGYLGVVFDRGWAGVSVNGLVRGGPADLGRLEVGDTITAIDGAPVANFADLQFQVGSALAGSQVRVTVSRAGARKELLVTLGKFKHDRATIAATRPEPLLGLRVDYNTVIAEAPIGPGPRNVRPLRAGVSVREVLPDSPAAAAFKKLGDDPAKWLVTHVGDTAVGSPADFYRAARGLKTATLTVIDATDPDARPREVPLP
jgi:serine protease Do